MNKCRKNDSKALIFTSNDGAKSVRIVYEAVRERVPFTYDRYKYRFKGWRLTITEKGAHSQDFGLYNTKDRALEVVRAYPEFSAALAEIEARKNLMSFFNMQVLPGAAYLSEMGYTLQSIKSAMTFKSKYVGTVEFLYIVTSHSVEFNFYGESFPTFADMKDHIENKFLNNVIDNTDTEL